MIENLRTVAATLYYVFPLGLSAKTSVTLTYRVGGQAYVALSKWNCGIRFARFRDALFSAILGLAAFDARVAAAQEVKQIQLDEQHIQAFVAATKEMAKLFGGVRSNLSGDPKMQFQADALVKKNGFTSLAEFEDVSDNIMMIMAGVDPQTKTFQEPVELMKQAITALKADKSVSQAEKKERLAVFGAAMENAKPIEFQENIALVLKYYDELPVPHSGEREVLCALDLRFSCGP
jgi:hypothetical protein